MVSWNGDDEKRPPHSKGPLYQLGEVLGGIFLAGLLIANLVFWVWVLAR